jgi:hypothetical protein
MVHQNGQLLDKYQTLVDQNNRILQHFGLENQNRHGDPVDQQVTPTPCPDAAPDNRPTPPGVQAAVGGPNSPAARTAPPSPAGPGWAPPLPAAVVQPVMTVNQALMPARVSQGCKGQTHSGETLLGILRAWWYDPDEQCFKSLRTAGPNLDCQVAWVHHELFGGRNKKQKPIMKALRLLDATWSRKERDDIIHKRQKDYAEASQLYFAVCKRAKYAAHIIKQGETVTKTKLPRQATDAVSGLYNNIYKFHDLENYVPDWENGGAIKAGHTLMEYIEEKVAAVQVVNPYNHW